MACMLLSGVIASPLNPISDTNIRYFPRIIIVISSNFLPLADSKSAYEMFQSFVVIMFENLRVALLLLLLRCDCAATALLRLRLQLLMKVNKPVAR